MNPEASSQRDLIAEDEFTKLSREERRTIERRGKRAVYDLPEELIKVIALIAEQNQTTHSMIAGALLVYGLREVQAGRLKIKDLRIPCESPRYEYKIDLVSLMTQWGLKHKQK